MGQEEKPSVIKVELKRIGLQELVQLDDLLGSAPLFKAIGPQSTTGLLTTATTRRVPAGQAVFAEGTAGTSLFMVLRGEVGLGRGQGKSAVDLGTVSKGEFFGEGEVLGPSDKRGYTATAIGQADLAEFAREQVAALYAKHFELYGLLREVREAREKAKDDLADFLDRW
jgi:CRP-like cAMP-binding protein